MFLLMGIWILGLSSPSSAPGDSDQGTTVEQKLIDDDAVVSVKVGPAEEHASLSVDTTHITFVGPPACVGALAQELNAHGLSAHYGPPFETKDAATAMAAVAVAFAVTGPVKDILAGVRAFRGRFPGTQIGGLPEDQRPSVRERLAHVDELLADGTIDAAENVQQRARILNEL